LKLDAEIEDEEGLLLYENIEVVFSVVPVFESTSQVVLDFEESAATWAIDTLSSKNIIPGTRNRILRFGTSKLFGRYSYRLFMDSKVMRRMLLHGPAQHCFCVA
jgi:hypothetical protein